MITELMGGFNGLPFISAIMSWPAARPGGG
jgi:hypothetical protein